MNLITDNDLEKTKQKLQIENNRIFGQPVPVKVWQIKQELRNRNILLDESTIRGRLIAIGNTLSTPNIAIKNALSTPTPSNPTPPDPTPTQIFNIPQALIAYIPDAALFDCYIVRPVDKKLEIHYNNMKHPITQGKQGTGKTLSHQYYAFKNKLPFFLFNGHEDFDLKKYFGDKTIKNGSIVFQESLLVQAIQCPSVILFDEINAISNANTFDFHAMLQNKELFVKDADDGKGFTYKIHPQCRIGFAQNPKSAKYIGGSIKPSNFLSRCTYVTYPDFTKAELTKNLSKKIPTLSKTEIEKFIQFYEACCSTIESAEIPIDISIRQLHNIIDLYTHGLSLNEAIEDGLTSMLEAVSQPKSKDAFFRLAQGIWQKMMDKSINENINEAALK